MSYLYFQQQTATSKSAQEAHSGFLPVSEFLRQQPELADKLLAQAELLTAWLQQNRLALLAAQTGQLLAGALDDHQVAILLPDSLLVSYQHKNIWRRTQLRIAGQKHGKRLLFNLRNQIDIQQQDIFVWDECSDQPHVIRAPAFKRRVRRFFWPQHLLMLLTSLLVLPLAILCMPLFRRKPAKNLQDVLGLGINLDKGHAQHKLVEELGVKHLMLRVYMHDVENLAHYVDFANSFNPGGDKSFLILIVQDRTHIENLELSKAVFDRIFYAFSSITNEFQIGTTINRLKWGFYCVEEYLDFYRCAQQVRDNNYPQIQLLGPSVIDFEYYYNARAMFNFYPLDYDRVSALLYVDRRGAPDNRQYLFFNTRNKIRLLFSLSNLSAKVKHKNLYLTEANWPIKNTAPYSPTSEKECVNLEQYCEYMSDYIQTAMQTGMVSRIYWHQLIAPGYGLVDNRETELKKYPQFEVFKQLLAQDITCADQETS